MFPQVFFIQILLLLCCFSNLQAQNPNLTKLSHEELDSLANLYFEQGQYETAILCVKEIINKAKNNRQDSTHGLWTNNLGVLYQRMGKYPEAEALFLESQEARKRAFGELSDEYIQVLNNKVYVYRLMYKNEMSEQVYFELKRIQAAKGKEREEYAQVLHSLGDLYLDMGRFEEVIPLFVDAKDIRRRVLGEQHPNYATSLNNLALAYQKMGKYEEAEPLFIQANEIYIVTVGEKSTSYATALDNLALLYQRMERYEEAEKLFLKAKQILKDALGEQHQDYSYSLNNLAILYQSMKRYKEAEPLFVQALKIRKATFGEAHPRYARSLNNLAQFYKTMGEYEKAEGLFKQAIEISRKSQGEEHSEYADGLTSIAHFYADTDRDDLALAYIWVAAAVNSYNFDEIFPNVFSPATDVSLGKYQAALFSKNISNADYLKLAELQSRSSISSYEVFRAMLKILKKQCDQADSNVDWATKKNLQEKLYNATKAGMQVNEKIRNEFSGDNNKLRILKENASLVQYALESAIVLNSKEYVTEAFAFAEQNKSVLLADAVKGNRARTLGDLPDSLALKEIDLHRKKDGLKKQKHEAKTPEDKEKITGLENDLNAEIDVFLKSIKDKYPKYHALKYENITSNAKDIQVLLDDRTLFLEYFISPSAVYLFALTKNEVKLFQLKVKKDELKEQIQLLRLALTNYKLIGKTEARAYDLFVRPAHWFYKELLQIALTDNKIENLIVVTDGELGHLPFEVFLRKEAEQAKSEYSKLHYLVNDYNISYNYSATLFAAIQNSTENRVSNGQFLACAAKYEGIDSSSLTNRSAYFLTLRKDLKPLPAAIKEVQTLEESFKGMFLTSENATELNFKKNIADYSIIHLAMHGILNPHTPMLSSLAFTEDKDSLEDNFLQAFEISRLKMNAELVVLSACETGYGKFEQGEGVISLARSFMYAGVPSLVVSLWQVNDASTALIMKSFYQYLSEGLPKNLALRKSKLDYIQSAKGLAAHPAFWSPFIQLGDSRPIVLKTRYSWLSILAMAGGSVLLLGLGGWWARKKISISR